jgi:peptide/nickel transport system permease protein
MGVPIGILAATKPRSLRDRIATGFALTGLSFPTFFLGLLLLFVFYLKVSSPGGGLGLEIFPAQGYVPLTSDPLGWAQHLILPWFTLAIVNAATYSRMTRGSMLEVLGEDYIRTARSKGLSERRVTYRHALRSSLTPIVTLLGIDLGVLLGGAVVSEQIFGLNGIGRYAVFAVGQEDLPVLLGCVMFASFFIVVANAIIDVLYSFLDARVRLT